MRLLVTGTPGCGKTVLAQKLARELEAKLVDVNALIEENKIYKRNSRGEKVVDLKKLQSIIEKILVKEKSVVVESHLLCEIQLQCDEIVVLRCNPLVLRKRLQKRGYPAWKIRENVIAEMLDYCLIKAESNYVKEKIISIDFTKPAVAQKVLAKINKGKSDSVDWMGEFGKVKKSLEGFLE